MNDIYWIITIGNLSTAFIVILFISSLLLAVAAIMVVCNLAQHDREESEWYKLEVYGVKVLSVVFVVSILGLIFVPSEKQMYAIYGIGGTIDYIKSNDKAKRLPDKVVNALDAWLDIQTKDAENGGQD